MTSADKKPKEVEYEIVDEEAEAAEAEARMLEQAEAEGREWAKGYSGENPVDEAPAAEPIGIPASEAVSAKAPRRGVPFGAKVAIAAGCMAFAVAGAVGVGAIIGWNAGQEPAPAPAPQAAQEAPAPAQAQPEHVHAWEPVYGDVHVDATYKTVHVDEQRGMVTENHTVCNVCQRVIDGQVREHQAATGHSAWTANVPVEVERVLVEAHDEVVEDVAAHDERKVVKERCSGCGEERDATPEEAAATLA